MSTRQIYAIYFDRSAGLPHTAIKILAAERVRIVGTPSGMDEVPDDARGSLLKKKPRAAAKPAAKTKKAKKPSGRKKR